MLPSQTFSKRLTVPGEGQSAGSIAGGSDRWEELRGLWGCGDPSPRAREARMCGEAGVDRVGVVTQAVVEEEDLRR